MSSDPFIWSAFFGLIALFLALDLFVFQREAHAVSMRAAAAWTTLWVLWAWPSAAWSGAGRARPRPASTWPAT